MDYKAVVKETPHVLSYLKKTIIVPRPGTKSGVIIDGEVISQATEEDVKYGVVVALKDQEGKIQYGWSVCAENDNFCKNRGKAIAILRAKSGKATWKNIPDHAISDILDKKKVLEPIVDQVL